MAEILLGRLLGPSGFIRPVVIKRILPHLARKPDFVAMFLDEARIVAGIHHRNVVQVMELGHENDELFLVMEYLEGESTRGLMRRLHARGETLDRALSLYVIAEACAGIHAAHELTDAEGKSLAIVHRDLTPHNVFIGYGGAVKVLDFGIAKAADSVARTEAGQFKGKFEYASPEQCRGAELDRRSDIFALGTILWELTTGKRLFKRKNQLEMQRAICELPIPSPASIVPDLPDDIAAVVMKAIARKRRERYQTALELRQDLLAALRKISAEVAHEDELAKLMRRLFEDRVEEKAEMLRRVKSGASVARIPIGEADVGVEIPIAVNVEYTSVPPDGTDTSSASDPWIPPPAGTGSSERLLATGASSEPDLDAPGIPGAQKLPRAAILAIGGVVTLLGVVLVAFALRGRSTPPTGTSPTASSASFASAGASSAASASATPAGAPASAESPSPSPAASAVASASASASAVASEESILHVETVPAKALVFVDGAKKGSSPLDLHLKKGTTPVTVEIRAPGYQLHKERVIPDMNQKLRLTLVPQAGPASSKPAYHRFD